MYYAKDSKGVTRYWNISVNDDDVNNPIIIKSYGVLNGKEVSTEMVVDKGKNIGKKNETTPLQQAHLVMESLIKKKIDEGYVTDITSLDNTIILPMLANQWKPTNNDDLVYVQPKLDGVRMMVGRLNNEIIAISRTGKRLSQSVIDVSKYQQYLKHDGDFLDGENYNHNISFEEITGICRTSLDSSVQHKNTHLIEFHVFDVFNIYNIDEPFHTRLARLRKLNYPYTVATRLISPNDVEIR